MRLGYSEVDITPKHPIALGGFAHRTGLTTEVHQPLYLRLVSFEQVWIFTADLLWWDEQFVLKWKSKLAEKGIVAIFHASHTHCSPNVHTELSDVLGQIDLDYIDYLNTCVQASINQIRYFHSTCIEKYKNTVDVGSYRRKRINGLIQMAPNVQQKINNNVTTLYFKEENELQLIIVHFACHPTVADINKISSEYCGTVISMLRKHYQVPVLFLQGFCGDIRAHLVANGEYYRGNEQEVEDVGAQIVQAIMESEQVLKSTLYENPIIQSTEIPFRLKDDVHTEINRSKRYEQEVLPFRTSHLALSDVCHFVFANAEVSTFYQSYLGSSLGVGYTDGMIGYIATEKQIQNGGYEGKDFTLFFGNRGPFDSSIEKTIHKQWKGWVT